MSKANGAIEKKDTFLQHVSLKNYKSIKDVEIDFKPGLNIIIGKNASGKTNFVTGLNKILNYEYNELLSSEFNIAAFFKKDKVSIITPATAQSEFMHNSHYHALKSRNVTIELNGNKINDKTDSQFRYSPIYALSERGFYFDKTLINYGVPYQTVDPFINAPFSFTFINNGKNSSDLVLFILSDRPAKFIGSFMERFNRFLFEIYGEGDILVSDIDVKNKILAFSKDYFNVINNEIVKNSPIQEIRLNPDFNIIKEDDGQKQTITNFYVEFLIDNSWVTFNLLSDGTKRLFYIVSEVLSTYNDKQNIYDNELKIVILEEPELGIHPHQLHQLMQFIKEQSREKQIILTTHSPQVLDALGPDELDRVIICHSDPKNGTQLSHLTDKEIAKAKKYMKEEAFLSDYWRFGDLEPA